MLCTFWVVLVIPVSIHCLHFTSDSSETVLSDVTRDIFVANQIGLCVICLSLWPFCCLWCYRFATTNTTYPLFSLGISILLANLASSLVYLSPACIIMQACICFPRFHLSFKLRMPEGLISQCPYFNLTSKSRLFIRLSYLPCFIPSLFPQFLTF